MTKETTKTNKEDKKARSGSLCAPDRFFIEWQNEDYYQEESILKEMDRVFEVCHGCRRCLNLCQAFPTLFDLIDSAKSGDLEPENHRPHYGDVVEQCYLCDRCYMNKCPYTPPHEWAIDFPHLMLRYKARNFKNKKTKFRDKLLSNPEKVGSFAGLPIVAPFVNKLNHSISGRALLEKTLGISKKAPLPYYHSKTIRKNAKTQQIPEANAKVVLFTTCYCNYNKPDISADLIKVFEHNQIKILVPERQNCCGMPKFELGDLKSVARNKEQHIKTLLPYVEKGYVIVAPIPSCVLMFKQELPLMFPEDASLKKIRNAFYDPFELLFELYKLGKFNTEFKHALGNISYHIACHLEVQNIGPKTQQILKLIPGTHITSISRCSGHDGSYAVKKEFYEKSVKIGKPVFREIENKKSEYFSSDCPLAAEQIAAHVTRTDQSLHPISLLCKAYGI